MFGYAVLKSFRIMSMKITEDCINCGACVHECPNHAIYEGNNTWNFSEGTGLTGLVETKSKIYIDTNKENNALDEDIFYVVEDKCTQCHLISTDPKCITICPIDCIINSKFETKEELVTKINWLYNGDVEKYLYSNSEENNLKLISEENSYKISDEFITEIEKDSNNKSLIYKIIDYLKFKY